MVQQKPFHRLIDALCENASTIGAKPALYLTLSELGSKALTQQSGAGANSESRCVSWRQLAAWVAALADRLKQLPLDPQRLVHCVNNSPADLLTGLACQAAGILEAPVDRDGGVNYLSDCREQIGAFYLDPTTKHQFVEDAWVLSQRPPLADRMIRFPTINAQQDALLLWTSGTSGRPKGVVLSHDSQLRNASAKLSAVPQFIEDRRLTVLSIAHGYARTCDIGTWLLSGCTLALARGYAGWDQTCDAYQPTLCNLVPSLAGQVLDRDRIPSSLRLVGCGGAALATHRFDQWQQRRVVVIQGYGLTEAGPVIASQTPLDSIAGHAGRFVSGWQYRSDQGRLFVRGKHMMNRYWMDADATAERIDAAGWLDTGDRVQIDPCSGQLEIQGRIDDRIVLSNGHKLDPQPIEDRFLAIPSVRSAVLVAKPNENHVELWLESDQRELPKIEIDKLIESLPRWEQPRTVRRLIVPDAMRARLFNRKGAIRRSEMLRFLDSATGS